MSVRQIVGLVLVVIGIVALVWGGVFWTDRDTILDAGPLEVGDGEPRGCGVASVVGIISLVAGAVLLLHRSAPCLATRQPSLSPCRSEEPHPLPGNKDRTS